LIGARRFTKKPKNLKRYPGIEELVIITATPQRNLLSVLYEAPDLPYFSVLLDFRG
jgi:hypothetical protein